jgi:hypothetical protein
MLIAGARAFNVGEMAHVIAQSAGGPRGQPGGGSDEYENLVLLCPTCHRTVDKAPGGVFPDELLHRWKTDHETTVRSLGKEKTFGSLAELKTHVARLLAENKALWHTLGPTSPSATADPGSNLHEVWALRKLDTIIPNNSKIVNAIEANTGLLSAQELGAFFEFKIHAKAFEQHQYNRLDSYPMFPAAFEEAMTI